MGLVLKPNIEQAQHRGEDVEAVLYDEWMQFHARLEFQRDAAHGGKACRGHVANLVVAVVVGMASAGVDGAIYPSALCKMTVENIVEIGSEDDFLEELPDGRLLSVLLGLFNFKAFQLTFDSLFKTLAY